MRAGVDADGASRFDPVFRGQEKTVAPGFVSNSLEFEGIEIGVVELLPHPEEQYGRVL